MFGYIQANARELKLREYETYRGYYCGLCHTLGKRFGVDAQMLLSYDMTFLLMLLTALYEPRTQKERRHCLPHPLQRHLLLTNEVSDYAADMTVLLGYQKAADDRQDERGAKALGAGALQGLLRRDYKRLSQVYPRQRAALEASMADLSAAEAAKERDLDRVAGLTGRFLAEMFVWKDDIWREQLAGTGFYLGKFIYLMDAWDDREKDAKSGAYNLLNLNGLEDPAVLDILQDTMARCCRTFEQLPILETGEILRNILYSGVWMRYAQKRQEAPKKI